MGTTAALLLEAREFSLTCLFAETHSQLPDSESAAKVIDALNAYMNLKVDCKPLLEAAKKFEASLRQYIDKAKQVSQTKNDKTIKELGYIGWISLII